MLRKLTEEEMREVENNRLKCGYGQPVRIPECDKKIVYLEVVEPIIHRYLCEDCAALSTPEDQP